MDSSQKKAEGSSPDQYAAPGGGNASRDYLYDIFQRLSTIESQLSFITAAVDDSKSRIEAVSKDVTEAKARFATLKSIVSWATGGIWTVATIVLTFALTILGMWIKHKLAL